jgi:hypothetical protein
VAFGQRRGFEEFSVGKLERKEGREERERERRGKGWKGGF